MAAATASPRETTQAPPTDTPLNLTPEQVLEKYTPRQVEGDWYVVGDVRIEGERKAREYGDQMIKLHQQLSVPDLTSRLPQGFRLGTPRSRDLIWRGSVMELAMNETHLPDGKTINPFYDREWAYVWGSALSKTDIPEKRGRGYEGFSLEQLEDAIDSGKIPEHYRILLVPKDNYLFYGDSVLLRIPRVWRENEEREEAMRALERIKSTDKMQRDNMDNLAMRSRGSGRPVTGNTNEVTIKF